MIRFVVPILLATAITAPACGPIFPTMYAVRDLTETLLSMPRGSFSYELLQLTGVPAPRRNLPAMPAHEQDFEELCEALGDTEFADEALDAYRFIRSARVAPDLDADSALKWVPREFLLYAEGASHHHHERWPEALAAWKDLLALPADQRQRRSTWASYMCGEVYLKLMLTSAENWTGPAASIAEGEEASAYYQQVRKLAAEGFADTLDLAWSSLGQEARVAFLNENYVAALHGYLAQYETPTTQVDHSVEQSLRMTAARMLKQPNQQLARYAADSQAAPVLTAYLLSRKENPALRKSWMAAVAGTEPARHAARLAWLAYNHGEIDMARRLLGAEDSLDPMAQWLQAKLALWDGETEQAIAILESLAALNAESHGWPSSGLYGAWWANTYDRPFIDGELGLLYLARENYDAALDRFLRGGLWNDAAYVAEQVMTAQELERFVAKRIAPAKANSVILSHHSYWYSERGQDAFEHRLSYLLARRWMRIGERKRALEWYPEPHRERAAELDRMLARAEDSDESLEDRAAAKVKAARIIRDQGMELLGAELDPDWRTVGGSFDLGVAATERLQANDLFTSPAPAKRFMPSDDERARVAERDVADTRRFHYKKIASDMMWEAAQALPDNDPRTAEALYYGGTYLKNKYPQEADRFYKALVNRCRKLPIGQEADRRRWFPPNFPQNNM